MNLKSSLVRWGLPFVALLFFVAAMIFISRSHPTQTIVPAISIPASPPQSTNNSGVVAGAGVIQPASELIAIGSPVPGVVKTVFVKVGDTVKVGQILFALDDRETTAEIKAREAFLAVAKENVHTAEIELSEREVNLKLYESIGDNRAMTKEELTRRQFAMRTSTAKLATARANLAQTNAQLVQAVTANQLRLIHSPIDGKILQVKVRAGEFAPAMQLSEPLITLGSVQPLHVKIDIDEADIPRANLSSPASISARGASDKVIQATFIRVEPLVVPKRSLTNSTNERVDTRVLQVIYALPKDALNFYVGQQIDAFISAQPSANKVAPTTKKTLGSVSIKDGKVNEVSP